MTAPRYRIAVCLFGQYRTGDYCLPWIVKQYDFAETRFYAHTKAYAGYPNLEGHRGLGTKPSHDADHIRGACERYGVDLVDVVETVDDDPFSVPGGWHYASLFGSLQASVYHALARFRETDWWPDLIAVQRFDMLLGPQVTSFGQALAITGHQPDTLYVLNRSMRFNKEARQFGIHDVLLLGSPYTINTLVAETFSATQEVTRRGWQIHHFEGPNVFLRRMVDRCGLHVDQIPLAFALVRPDADLERDVFASDTFAYHVKHWTSSHVGLRLKEGRT